MEREETIKLFCSFLNSIEIEVIEKEIETDSFLPGLKITDGKLILDRTKLLYPGDILHEAGHIAVTSAHERNTLNDNVIENHPQKGGDEMAVLLWSYAACLHLKIDPVIVFHKDGYKGESEWLLKNFSEKTFIGLPLLVWMGMAHDQKKENGFPHMLKWLRD